MVNPLETRPESVIILALGPSNVSYVIEKSKKKNIFRSDEVWVCNTAINAFLADKAFIMDDLKRLERRFPEWSAYLKTSKVPIITSKAYEDYPSSIALPIEAMVKDLGDDFFSTSVAYMVAYAAYIRVRFLYLFGCDFYYPNSGAYESGSSCVAYWLGVARERGVRFKIPHNSSFLDANLSKIEEGKAGRRYMYGYDYNPQESKDRIDYGQATQMDHLVVAGKIPVAYKLPKEARPDGGVDV